MARVAVPPAAAAIQGILLAEIAKLSRRRSSSKKKSRRSIRRSRNERRKPKLSQKYLPVNH